MAKMTRILGPAEYAHDRVIYWLPVDDVNMGCARRPEGRSVRIESAEGNLKVERAAIRGANVMSGEGSLIVVIGDSETAREIHAGDTAILLPRKG